jgi:tetratricopeptide (TPR) repeat protein
MRNIVPAICLAACFLFTPAAATALPKEPPAPGQMTAQAAEGQRLFGEGRFGEAALVLTRVASGETSDAGPTRQLARYQLAIALYRLGFYQASAAQFAQIADQPDHVKYKETLRWLAKLSTELPEPAEIIERVGKYKSEPPAGTSSRAQRDLSGQLNYLLARYKYRNGNYKEAIRLLEKVDAKAKHYVEAQLLMGASYAQLRKRAPVIAAFERAVRALEEGAETAGDRARVVALANLSLARAYYSTSIRHSGIGRAHP